MSKRVVLSVAGAALVVTGAAMTTGGAAVAAAFGSDSSIGTGRYPISTTASALVTEKSDIRGIGTDVIGNPSVKVSMSRSGKPVFIGIGRASDVDRYLAGASVDTVTDFDVRPFVLDTRRREGSVRLGSPLDETFWLTSSDGTTAAKTTWDLKDGDYRLVVMNADGSPGVDADGRFALHVPHLTTIGVALAAGGLLSMGFGILLVVLAVRAKPEVPVVVAPAPEVAVTP